MDLGQPDVAINSGTRIPTREIRRVIQSNRELVLAAGHEIRREVDSPRRVTIRPATDQLAVQPYRRVRHRAIHIKENGFAGVARRDVELLAVPTNSRTRQPPHRSADATGVERAFDRPVMRQIYRTPAAVIEVGTHVRDVAPWIFI